MTIVLFETDSFPSRKPVKNVVVFIVSTNFKYVRYLYPWSSTRPSNCALAVS